MQRFSAAKYLTRELLEHNPLNFAKDANGNLLVDTERLKHSAIFQEAVHLRDFVAAYMAKYPDKVKTPGHFKTLLNNVKDWRGVLDYADAFFARLNDDAHLTDDMIKASRQGVEVIRVFPGKTSSWCVCVRLKRWTTKRPEWTTAWEKAAMTPPF